METLLSLGKLIVGIAVLVKGADFLITGASGLAKRAGVPDFVIGLTLVAFGTSLPELTVNVQASFEKASGITLGNVIGSNIANILLILGVAGLIRPIAVHRTFVKKEIPLNLLSVLVLFAMIGDKILDHSSQALLSRSEGLVLITTFVGYLYFLAAFLERDLVPEEELGDIGYMKASLLIVLGLAMLMFGADWTVKGAVDLSLSLGVSQTLVGLFLVAVGTSLPELFTSAVATYRGNSDIALGNVLGSNIFNVSFILGASAIVNPIPVPDSIFKDLALLFVSTTLLLISNYTGSRYTISKPEAGLFLITYILYAFYSWYTELSR